MTENHKVEWEPKLSVDIEEIDAQHKNVMALFNDLIEMKAQNDIKAVTAIISDVNDYGKLCFSMEEKVLKKIHYPDFETHTREHRRFIKNAINLRREVADDLENLTMESILELRDWLVNHIAAMDSLYVPFLRIHRYIEEANQK